MADYFVQGSKTILATFVENHPRNTFVNYFEIGPLALGEMSFKGFSIFSSDGPFVQRSGTILAILVEGHPRNIFIKSF